MKANYDFSKAIKGKHVDRIPADAVFVRFDPEVSHLLDGRGDLRTRLLALARTKSPARTVRTVAMSPAQYRALRPLLERLGATTEESVSSRPSPAARPAPRTRRKAS